MSSQIYDDARLARLAADWMTDAVAGTASDEHLNQILTATGRMRPSPRWLALLKEPPMRIQTQTRLVAGLPGRRLIFILATLALLVLALVASIVWYAGSHQPDRPAPVFGLARNGSVFTTNGDGDIISVDPNTNAQRTIASGPNLCCATTSPDGQRLAILHVPPGGGDPLSITIARPDGTIIREIPTSDLKDLHGAEWAAWSPAGDELLLTTGNGPLILDLETGARTHAGGGVHQAIEGASWIGTTGDILLTTASFEDQVTLFRRNPADRALGLMTLRYAVAPPLVSPDGSKFLYFLWDPNEPGLQGVLHVVDLTYLQDRRASPADDSYQWENPVWSPDGNFIAAEQYIAGDGGYQIAIIPAEGGPAVLAGPRMGTGTGGAIIRFSPDGTSLLVTYRDDNSTWLLPATGGEGRQVDWSADEDFSWQRLAP
jgi:hypothetical protein